LPFVIKNFPFQIPISRCQHGGRTESASDRKEKAECEQDRKRLVSPTLCYQGYQLGSSLISI